MINNTSDIGDVVKEGGKEQEIIRGQLADFVKNNYNSLFFARLATYINLLPYYEFKDFFKIDFHLFLFKKKKFIKIYLLN